MGNLRHALQVGLVNHTVGQGIVQRAVALPVEGVVDDNAFGLQVNITLLRVTQVRFFPLPRSPLGRLP